MAFSTSLPPSMVAKLAKTEGDGDEPQKQSREDYKKMKELEEARKAGTVPAMQDEEGKDINPHIPQYIMQAPWYFGENRPTLKHQRPQDEKKKIYSGKEEWYKKGVKEGPVTTKYRKGACENCGAMTHKKKDCLERPRKIGAKYTGDNFAPDEYIQANLSFDYEGKRDRWNGYNPEEHQKVYEQFEKLEAAKRLLKEQKVEEDLLEKKESGNEQKTADSDDEDKYAEDVAMPGQKFETKQRITVRNLRIREDMAKYLYNLDPNSAFYDPKTRSMRENPLKNTGKEGEIGFRGDNIARFSGDATQFAKQQMFAWEAYEHGTDVHIQADPTKLALLTKEVEKRKEDTKSMAKNSILEKYGGEEHLEAPPKQLLMAQTEDYVEYSRTGSVIKGAEKPVVRSKYQEDVYINNHTSVWGSFWRGGKWGYKCCHSMIKESYCTGQAGIEAAGEKSLISQEIDTSGYDKGKEEEEAQQKSLLQQHQEEMEEKKKKKKKKKKNKHKKKKKRSSSSSDESDNSESENEERKAKKLKKAIEKELEHQKKVSEIMALDERKRPYNSMFEAKLPSEEEMEAWRMKRARKDDPMAAF